MAFALYLLWSWRATVTGLIVGLVLGIILGRAL